MQPLYISEVALLSIYYREIETCAPTKTCAQMFPEALFILAPNQKQHRCLSMGKQLKCGTFLPWNTTEQYKCSHQLTHSTTWTEPQEIMLSKKRQPPKDTYCMVYVISQLQRWRTSWWLPRVGDGGMKGMGVATVLYLDCDVT